MKSIVSALLVLVTCAGCAQDPPPMMIGTQVDVPGGTIRGLVQAGVALKQYHGIPFAAAPVGNLRWAPPAPVTPWDGVRDATAPGPVCVQPSGGDIGIYSNLDLPQSDEDCLTLNIWTEAANRGEKRPVMFWVHGGALVTGAGSTYPGQLLASKGVVLVTINYRLGRFGFLAHPELTTEGGGVSGNQGLRDQIQALTWVRDNIRKFGGDPGNVTIFGESAGSLSVSLLQGSPLARGMFHRAIGQSGGAFQPMQYRDRKMAYGPSGESVGQLLGSALGGNLATMRAASAAQIMAAVGTNPIFSSYDALAIVDGTVIPRDLAAIYAAGEQADVPVLIGSNADEATTFMEFFASAFGQGDAGYQAWRKVTLPEAGSRWNELYPGGDSAAASWERAFTDVSFTYPTMFWARSMDNVTSDAYQYLFAWQPPVAKQADYRAFHAAELGYIFGNVGLFGAQPTAADRQFSSLMSDIWVRFAKTGNPNGAGLPAWPPYSPDGVYMTLGPTLIAGSRLRADQMAVIDKAMVARRTAAAATVAAATN